MPHRIYLVTNLKDGRRYVGVTTTPLRQRLMAHHCDGPMAADLKALGYDAFTIEELECHDGKQVALQREAELILSMGTHEPQGYNGQVRGGRYPGRCGKHLPGNKNSRRRAVTQLTPFGETVASWPTVMDAAKSLGIQRNTIHRAIANPEYTAGGFKWRDASNSC